VAALGWGKDTPVGEWLYEEPYGFDFFQAVRLLELASPDGSVPVGDGAEPAREPVRFRSGVGLDFPASDVAEVRPPKNGEEGVAPRMTVNFMGLAGATGPLNTPSTELIIEREFHGDDAPRDFLDIFNHRLVSLLYRTRKLNRVALDNAEPGEDRVASYLYSVAGLGTASLRGRMQVRDRALLFYAGLLGQQPRSMAGLEAILSHYFGVRAVGVPFKGRWHELEQSQWTRIGESGQNATLGVDAVVGKRVWDEQGAFEVELGPLTLEQFEDFLPTGWAFRPLCDLVRFYVGDELDFSFRLKLAGEELASSWLALRPGGAGDRPTRVVAGAGGASPLGGPRLGWNSRIRPRRTKAVAAEVVISPASPKAIEGAFSFPYFGLPPDKLQELFSRMRPPRKMPLVFGAGQVVARQGERGEAMYFVRRGRLKVVRRGEDGVEHYLGGLGPGDYFGELALITGRFRRASAVTLEECELLELSKKDLDEFAEKYPRFRSTLEAYARTRTRKGGRRRAAAKDEKAEDDT
jgi:type VI secretion system protein ImpH